MGTSGELSYHNLRLRITNIICNVYAISFISKESQALPKVMIKIAFNSATKLKDGGIF